MLLAVVILLVTLVPLIELMTTTTKGTKLTRDHLVAYNLAQMAFEQVVHHSTLDNANRLEDVAQKFNRAETQTAPNGCPGVSIANLSNGPADIIMPEDNDPKLNFQTGDPDFVTLFKLYSYSMKITLAAAGADTVITPDSKVALARVDIKVYWKNNVGQCQSIRYSDYFARRKY